VFLKFPKTPTLNRAALGELFSTFLLTLVLCTTVLLFERVFRIMKVSQGIATLDVLKLILFIQPSFLLLGIPMSLLVAILIVYGRMTMDNEITILMASGSPFSLITRPAVRFATACLVASLVVSLYLFPLTNRLFRETLYEAFARSVSIDEGVFNDRFPGLLVYVKNKISDSSYGDLFIYNTRNPDKPVVIAAGSGEILSDPEKGVFQFLLKDGNMQIMSDLNGYTYISFGQYYMEFDIGGIRSTSSRGEMYLGQLWHAATEVSQKHRSFFLIEFHKRLALPFACLILGFLAAPLGTMTGKAGRMGGFGIALGVMVGYHILFMGGENIAQVGKIPVWLAIWAPNILLAGLSIPVYWWKTKH